MGRSSKSTTLVSVLIAISAFASGCTSPDEDHGGGMHGGDGALPLDGTESVTLRPTSGSPDEFRFTPATLEVQTGERVAVSFTNAGQAAHEFSINDLGFHLHAEAGQTLDGAFIAPEPGEYTFACYVPGHFESGMKGTLVVKA